MGSGRWGCLDGYTTPEKTVSFSYNEAGNLLSYDDGTTSGSFSYDAFGRRIETTVDYGPFQLSHGTTYTESGRKKSLTYPDGSTYEYSYNEANRIQSMDLPDSGQITWGEYDWRRPTSVSLPGGASKSFDLDPLQRIKEITSRDPAGNTVLHREYDYDKAGNIVSEKTAEGKHDYGYDPLNRLIKAENPTLHDEEYSYDAVGNRLTSADTNGTWSYNSNNELLAYNNATCSFDDNSNMVKRVVNGQVTRYIYNANNQLVRVESDSGDVIAKYYYDPFGRRLWKEVNGERTYFHYTEQGLIAEYDNQGDPIRFYGYKPGSSWTTDPVFLKKDGSYYFYHNDHLGTPQKMTARNGRVVWSARYASFGGSQLVEQEIKNPLRFPGQYYDEESSLHYNWHRYYDPKLGRYLTADPIGLNGGINLFIYALNNSISSTDKQGLSVDFGLSADFYIIGGSHHRIYDSCCNDGKVIKRTIAKNCIRFGPAIEAKLKLPDIIKILKNAINNSEFTPNNNEGHCGEDEWTINQNNQYGGTLIAYNHDSETGANFKTGLGGYWYWLHHCRYTVIDSHKTNQCCNNK